MSPRVLMIGPGREVTGGIASVAEMLVPALEKLVDLRYFSTVKRRPLKDSGKISRQNFALALCQYARFLCALCRFRPQIVHVHTSQGIAWLKDSVYVIAAKACGRRVVIHVHAADFDELYAKRPRFVRSYTRAVMGRADAVIAVSDEWKRCITRIAPPDRVFVLRNCVAVNAVLPRRFTDGPAALFLGSVGSRKGAFDLVEAMGRLKSTGCPLRVWIAGPEEREGDFCRLQAMREELQLGETLQLIGSVRGAEKADLLARAEIFVLPSYQEGLPIAVLEAMAARLPVVATPVGGIPEVVKDGYNGFLVAPGDVETLAKKLAALANDRSLREVMGDRSREAAEGELDVEPYVARLVALYGLITAVENGKLERHP